MSYAYFSDAVKDLFKLDGFGVYFGLNLMYEDFENDFSLQSNSVCISYNGVEPSGDMEDFNYLRTENITIYVKSMLQFDVLRRTLKDYISSLNTTVNIGNEEFVLSFKGLTITKINDYLIGELTYSMDSVW